MLKEGYEPIPGYRLLNFLGRGQFGEVWRATSPGGTHIALKFLNVRERQGRKEFRAIQKVKGIRYPHLVQTYALWLLDENMHVIDDAAFDSSQPILVDSVRATMIRQPLMQSDSQKPSMLVIATVLCDQNLMERLEDCKKKGERGIPAQELLGYIEDAAKAIDFLNSPRHELGEGSVAIHHCDIKPENIMILGDLAVVGDFGVARILTSGADSRATATMGGSVAYAAPETYDNRTSPTSDQYSLAVTYYELRTGKLPYPDETQTQVMRDKLAGRLDFRDVSPREAKVLRRATSVDPASRFPSARAFVESMHVAVRGKKNSKRTVDLKTLLVAASALTLTAVLILWAMKNPKEREPEKIDGAGLYAEAMDAFRQSDLGVESMEVALEKSVRAIKEGGFVPTVSSPIGMDLTPIFQTNEDSLDENHSLKLVAISPDRRTLVKAVQHTLHFSSLISDQTIQIELQNAGDIAQLAWMQEEIVLLDKSNRLIKVNPSNGIPKRDDVIASQTAISFESPIPKVWYGMSRSEDRKKLLLLDGEESKSIGTFKTPPGKFHVSVYTEGTRPIEFETPLELLWKDRPPTVFVDQEGRFFVGCANYDGEVGTLTHFSEMPNRGIEFGGMPSIGELQEVTKVVFVDSNGGFLLTGISEDTEEDYRLIFGWIKDGKGQLSNVPLPNALPIGSMLIESPESVLVAQSTKLLRCVRNASNNEWQTRELFDFEDGLMPDGNTQEGSTGRIHSICKLNDRWIMTGHETGKSMILSQDSGSPPTGFAICPKLDCAIQDIWVTNDKVVLVGQDGRLIWFELADVILNAEACKKAGVAPLQTKSSSVRS